MILIDFDIFDSRTPSLISHIEITFCATSHPVSVLDTVVYRFIVTDGRVGAIHSCALNFKLKNISTPRVLTVWGALSNRTPPRSRILCCYFQVATLPVPCPSWAPPSIWTWLERMLEVCLGLASTWQNRPLISKRLLK